MNQVEVMRATRMFLLQTKGPTRFVVRGEESDRKFTVLVGNRARCSCGVPLCLHHLFIMLKVLKVPPSNPLAWQTALIDSEVDYILSGGGGTGVLREADGDGDTARCSGGSAGGGGGGGHPRLEIAPGEVCPVCQEEMDESGGEGEDGGKAVAAKGDGGLTYCRDGCGNNMHAR
ncbi:unnamed protein product [Ectocarpus sp. 4 AP-2014]